MIRAQLPQNIYHRVLNEARDSPEAEICGLISAHQHTPVRCYSITNAHPRPASAFDMAAGELVCALRHMREQGEQLWAIYHSHPQGPGTPSSRDIAECGYPETLHLVITPHLEPPLHAWRYAGQDTMPVRLEIV